jgi:hypothetical protein
MRVLFLDFDGVLNSVGSFIYNNRQNLLGFTQTPTHQSFCPIASSNLQYILEELSDVQVVATSSWRKNKTIEALKKIFETNNILPDRMIGATPVDADRYRGNEIKKYLDEHTEVTDFVILDDDIDMNPYLDNLVKTDSRDGLTFSKAERVIEMFGGKLKTLDDKE